MPRCVYIYSIRFFDDSTRNNIFIGTNRRIESVILKDWSEESWTMSSTELPVSNQWFRVEIHRRVDGSIQKISNLLMHFTGCITPWFLVCICVFVCIFLYTAPLIRRKICWCTTFTASTLYCEYRQLRRTFRCAHLSQMEWILFKCRVSQLRGRKEGKEITDATVSHLTQLLRTILTGGAYICCVRCNQNSFKCRDKSHSELQTFCICIGICVFV